MQNKVFPIKAAIIHDVFLYIGGAEKVLFTLIKLYPNADIYISLITPKCLEILKSKTSGRIFISLINRVPFSKKLSSFLKPFILLYWEQLNLSDYDLVISSSHSFSSKSVVTQNKTLHISYIYTAPRYLYTEYNENRAVHKPLIKLLISPLLAWLRMMDYIGAQRPDILIAVSKIVQGRIKKYYRRESFVIYPSINKPKYLKGNIDRKYYIFVSRLVKQKGLELVIKAFNKLQMPLVVIGKGKEKKRLQKIAGATILFKGFVSDNQLSELYSRAKALIYCSIDEDFGLVPVEAMGHGIPVIAYNSGAVIETVIPNKTGILFNEYTENSLISAIHQFGNLTFSAKDCKKYANHFSETVFKNKWHKQINKHFRIKAAQSLRSM